MEKRDYYRNWQYSSPSQGNYRYNQRSSKIMAGLGVKVSDNINLNISLAREYDNSTDSAMVGLKYSFC